MKKLTILSVAFLAISFASCKKDRTCSCTTTHTSTAYADETLSEEITLKKTSKGRAKRSCVKETWTSANDVKTTDCKLK